MKSERYFSRKEHLVFCPPQRLETSVYERSRETLLGTNRSPLSQASVQPRFDKDEDRSSSSTQWCPPGPLFISKISNVIQAQENPSESFIRSEKKFNSESFQFPAEHPIFSRKVKSEFADHPLLSPQRHRENPFLAFMKSRKAQQKVVPQNSSMQLNKEN